MKVEAVDYESDPITIYRDFCPRCKRIVDLWIINEEPTDLATGLLGTQLLECQECGTKWRV